jgi:hypothetical protein
MTGQATAGTPERAPRYAAIDSPLLDVPEARYSAIQARQQRPPESSGIPTAGQRDAVPAAPSAVTASRTLPCQRQDPLRWVGTDRLADLLLCANYVHGATSAPIVVDGRLLQLGVAAGLLMEFVLDGAVTITETGHVYVVGAERSSDPVAREVLARPGTRISPAHVDMWLDDLSDHALNLVCVRMVWRGVAWKPTQARCRTGSRGMETFILTHDNATQWPRWFITAHTRRRYLDDSVVALWRLLVSIGLDKPLRHVIPDSIERLRCSDYPVWTRPIIEGLQNRRELARAALD